MTEIIFEGKPYSISDDKPMFLKDIAQEINISIDYLIDYLLESVKIISSILGVADIAGYSLYKNTSSELKRIKVAPLYIDELKERIRFSYLHSVVISGKPVGSTAADALSQQISQMTFNSFKQAGAGKNISDSFNAIKEVIEQKEEKKFPSVSIIMKDPNITKYDFLIKKYDNLVFTSISSLLYDNFINTTDSILLDVDSTFILPYWYYTYLYMKKFVSNSNFLEQLIIKLEFNLSKIKEERKLNTNEGIQRIWMNRLILDINKMYSKNIILEDICKAISRIELYKNTYVDNMIVCIPSPIINDPNNILKPVIYIDMFIIDDILREKYTVKDKKVLRLFDYQNYNDLLRHPTYFNTVLSYKLDIYSVKGYKKINDANAVETNILDESGIIEEIYGDNKWKVNFDNIRMNREGINIKQLTNLYEVAGMIIENIDEISRFMIIEIPNSLIQKININDYNKQLNIKDYEILDYLVPHRIIKYLYSNEQNNEKKYYNVLKKQRDDELKEFSKSSIEDELRYKKEQNIMTETDNSLEVRNFLDNEDTLNKDEKNIRKTIKNMNNEKIYDIWSTMIIKSPGPIKSALLSLTIITDGDNYDDIIFNKDVDKLLTMSNNINKVREKLGIEAARNFFITEILRILNAIGSSIDPRHIVLIADFVCRSGNLSKISRNFSSDLMSDSISRSFLSTKITKDIASAARVAHEELVGSYTSSIITGAIPKIGTGSVDVIPPSERLKQSRENFMKKYNKIKKDRGRKTPLVSSHIYEKATNGHDISPAKNITPNIKRRTKTIRRRRVRKQEIEKLEESEEKLILPINPNTQLTDIILSQHFNVTK